MLLSSVPLAATLANKQAYQLPRRCRQFRIGFGYERRTIHPQNRLLVQGSLGTCDQTTSLVLSVEPETPIQARFVLEMLMSERSGFGALVPACFMIGTSVLPCFMFRTPMPARVVGSQQRQNPRLHLSTAIWLSTSGGPGLLGEFDWNQSLAGLRMRAWSCEYWTVAYRMSRLIAALGAIL